MTGRNIFIFGIVSATLGIAHLIGGRIIAISVYPNLSDYVGKIDLQQIIGAIALGLSVLVFRMRYLRSGKLNKLIFGFWIMNFLFSGITSKHIFVDNLSFPIIIIILQMVFLQYLFQ